MSADGTILVLGDTKSVTIYDAASYKPLQQFADFGTDIFLSHNGRILSVIKSVKWGGQDLTITLWDTLTGTLIAETDKPLRAQAITPLIIYPSNYKTDMKLNYDGRLLAVAYLDGSIRLWDLLTNREVAVLKGHTSAVSSIQFSPDGTKLYSASGDGTVRQWGLPD